VVAKKELIKKENTQLILSKTKGLMELTNKLLKRDSRNLLKKNIDVTPFLSISFARSIYSFLITPDERYILLGYGSGFEIWELESQTCVERVKNGHISKFLDFIDDTKFLMVNSTKVELWDFESLERISVVYENEQYINDASISPNKKIVALKLRKHGEDEEDDIEYIKIIDIENGKELANITNGWFPSIICENDYIIYTGQHEDDDNFDVYIFLFRDNVKIRLPNETESSFYRCALSKKRQYIAAGSRLGIINIYDISTNKCIKVINTNTEIDALTFSDDEKYVIVDGRNKEGNSSIVQIWDIESGVYRASFEKRFQSKKLALFKNSFLLSITDNGAEVYDLATQDKVISLFSTLGYTSKVMYHHNGNQIISTTVGETKIWNSKTGKLEKFIKTGEMLYYENNIAYILNGSHILPAIYLYDMENQKIISTFSLSKDGDYFKIAFSKKYVAMVDGFSELHIYEKDNFNFIQEITCEYLITDVLFLNEEQFAVAVFNYGIRVYSAKSKGIIKSYPDTKDACALAKYENSLIVGYQDASIKVLDIDSGKVLKTIGKHEGNIESLLIHNNKLVSHSEESIKVWDIDSSKCLKTLKGENIDTISISPDGKKVVSANKEDIITIWDIEREEALFSIYNYEHCPPISMNKKGFFIASDEAIEKQIRVRTGKRSARKLTKEEIDFFRIKEF